MPISHNFEVDSDGYVSLGDVCRDLMGRQAQYGCPYFDPITAAKRDLPYLGEGLRIKGDCQFYHEMRIHLDDIEEAVKRHNNRFSA